VADRKLTLTFDHGPTPGVTERVLDVLRDRDLRATFLPEIPDHATPLRRGHRADWVADVSTGQH
jgi:hypothetical protein